MPSVERTFQSQLLGAVNKFLDDKRVDYDTDKSEFLSVLDFIDRFQLLPYGLYPAQKFIVKLYYNIPLDYKEKTINVTDKFNTKVLYSFTETEYLKYLYDQGRCNIKEQDGKDRRELILVIGRRGSKSTLVALFAAYELYKLIARGNPQGFYGIPPNSEIQLFCIANDKDQASIVFNDMKGHVERVDFFKKSLFNNTQTYMRFQTENDRVVFGRGKATIKATFKSSVAKGLRGRGTILLILDELAHFVEEGGTSADKVYNAITPSTAAFSPKDINNKHVPIGPSDGRVISISSPNAKSGFFFKLYQMSLENSAASKNMLMLQAPTWEINPTISTEYYETEYHKDPNKFWTEFGAQFSDRVRGWIENATDLTNCVDVDLKPAFRGSPRKPYFFGFDLGLVEDGSAVALTHINKGKIELAYHEVWYAGKRWEEVNPHLSEPIVPYAKILHDIKRLDLEQISDWILALSKRFYIQKGLFDQWVGIVFENELHKRGLTQFEMRNFFKVGSSQMYQTFKMFMYSQQLRLYDYPVPEILLDDSGMIRHSPLIQELLELQSTASEKNIMTVAAPDVSGKHDDMSDALARSILLAAEFVKDHPDVLTDENYIASQGGQNVSPIRSYKHYQRIRTRMHGLPDKNRIVPIQNRRR